MNPETRTTSDSGEVIFQPPPGISDEVDISIYGPENITGPIDNKTIFSSPNQQLDPSLHYQATFENLTPNITYIGFAVAKSGDKFGPNTLFDFKTGKRKIQNLSAMLG